VVPTSISFCLDDSIITYLLSPDHTFSRKVFAFDYLLSPDHTFSRKVFAFDLKTGKQELFFSRLGGR
jgi:dipeptidyl-peptidase-4